MNYMGETLAMELKPPDTMDLELEDCCEYVSVRLRLRSVSLDLEIVKAEPAMATAVQVRNNDFIVKELKGKIWRLGREKGQLLRDYESKLHTVQAKVNIQSREVLKNIQTAAIVAKESGEVIKRAKANVKYFRKQAYKFGEENKVLKEQLMQADLAAKVNKREADQALRACAKARKLEQEAKNAYRGRAQQQKELQKQCQRQREELAGMETLAQVSAEMAQAEWETAQEAHAETEARQQRLDAAEARIAELEVHSSLAEDALAENELEHVAHRLIGEQLQDANEKLQATVGARETALSVAAQKIQDLRDEVAKLKMPAPANRLTDAAERTVRLYEKQDMDWLLSVFQERAWSTSVLAKVLDKAGLLPGLFNSKEVWRLRLDWIKGEMQKLRDGAWSVDATIGLMIDNVMSFGDLHALRQALSLEYIGSHDRCMHRMWIVNPYDLKDEAEPVDRTSTGRLQLRYDSYVRFPEPIPAVDKVRLRFKEIEGDLKIEVSDDGKIATHRFKEVLVSLHEESKALGLINPSCPTPYKKVDTSRQCTGSW